MENFLIAVNAILPVFLVMAVGMLIKKREMIDDSSVVQTNSLVFKIFLPVMIFNSVYETSLDSVMQVGFLAFILFGVFAAFLVITVIIVIIEKAPERRGVMIQAIFRSNYLILGMPIVESLFGSEKVGMTAVSIALVVPLFNILAVVALESFRFGTFDLSKVMKGIVTNPLIWGCVFGLLALFSGIHLPYIIEKTLEILASIGTPLALITLGASLHLDAIKGNLWHLSICVLGKLVFLPAVMLPIAAALGFRDVQLGTIMAVFASPTAVSSFIMAQQRGCDGELAGEAIVFSSLVSCVTIIFWTFMLKQFGLM